MSNFLIFFPHSAPFVVRIKPPETLVPAYPPASERGIRELRSLLGRPGAGATHVHDVLTGRVPDARFPADPEDLPIPVVGQGECSAERTTELSPLAQSMRLCRSSPVSNYSAAKRSASNETH